MAVSSQLEPRGGCVPRIATTCITSLTLGGGGRPPGSWSNSGSAQHLQHCPPGLPSAHVPRSELLLAAHGSTVFSKPDGLDLDLDLGEQHGEAVGLIDDSIHLLAYSTEAGKRGDVRQVTALHASLGGLVASMSPWSCRHKFKSGERSSLGFFTPPDAHSSQAWVRTSANSQGLHPGWQEPRGQDLCISGELEQGTEGGLEPTIHSTGTQESRMGHSTGPWRA